MLSVLVDWVLSSAVETETQTAAGMDATTVPVPLMPVTLIVQVMLSAVDTVAASVPPTVLPVKATSVSVNPLTASENTAVNTTGEALVGSPWPPA